MESEDAPDDLHATIKQIIEKKTFFEPTEAVTGSARQQQCLIFNWHKTVITLPSITDFPQVFDSMF